ncbi:hypothetical protein B7P43_G14684 [Cryptotermes secundus]|uniref:Endonuclease/exonuclease/phosphatase domain-containing protein n=1 Tax=Cryptotermes secundus TaxID=105785 RepID=A0A2J7QYC3_9NEOP|nr:hypothetical protein B7P43_G14684 [Cryptotermes secundus]
MSQVLGLKQVELYDNICSTDYNIICLTETWLNDLCYDHNLFPDCYTVFRSDKASVNKTRGGGVLTALSSRIRSCKRRYDLESCDECVWVEIPTSDCLNLLIGNHYFPPDANTENIANYFSFLENNLDTHNFRVIMVGDFNAPGFDWKSGLALPNSHYYSKLKGDAIYTSTCLLNLNQCIDNVRSSNLLDLIFSNLSDISITPIHSGPIKPDNYHKTECLYQKFSFYRKLVKITIKSDRLRWLKTVEENLKSQPKQFWKYVASFKKRNPNSIQLEVDGKHLIKPNDIDDEFSKHFQAVYHNPGPIVFPNLLSSSEFLPLASLSESDVMKAIKRLRPSKSVGVDDIPGFIIKGCTDIFVPILKHIFNLSLSQHYLPPYGSKQQLSLFSKKAKVPLLAIIGLYPY